MKSLLLRNWAIVAILVQSVSATATLRASNEDLHNKEEARAENEHDLNSRRVQTNRIVGGNQATKGEYPYFVQWGRVVELVSSIPTSSCPPPTATEATTYWRDRECSPNGSCH
ncbi:hypothetical protein MHU86_20460 [Fragilaria crotonensis]|nr:hypothetical protein MHU86_20460 [Fragilaria crotonensis]